MITYISGKLVEKNPTYVIVEAGGIGYYIHISLQTYAEIPDIEAVKLYTYFHVKEDAQSLYGFSTLMEREIFKLLISVSGVGTATARIMLSSLNSNEIQQAIAQDDAVLLTSIKGIGAKTAQRIIIELRDKMLKTYAMDEISTPTDNTIKEEALSALDVLGFSRKQTQRIVDKILRENSSLDIEGLIKNALKNL